MVYGPRDSFEGHLVRKVMDPLSSSWAKDPVAAAGWNLLWCPGHSLAVFWLAVEALTFGLLWSLQILGLKVHLFEGG